MLPASRLKSICSLDAEADSELYPRYSKLNAATLTHKEVEVFTALKAKLEVRGISTHDHDHDHDDLVLRCLEAKECVLS